MTKLKKRVVSACLAVMLVASIGALGVSANNYKNTTFSFKFIPTNGTAYTGARPKTDDSYSWMQCTGGNANYTAHVVAESAYSNEMFEVGSPNYTFRAGDTPSYMTNYVKENHYDWAGILAQSGNIYQYGTATGYWSPDSI